MCERGDFVGACQSAESDKKAQWEKILALLSVCRNRPRQWSRAIGYWTPKATCLEIQKNVKTSPANKSARFKKLDKIKRAKKTFLTGQKMIAAKREEQTLM